MKIMLPKIPNFSITTSLLSIDAIIIAKLILLGQNLIAMSGFITSNNRTHFIYHLIYRLFGPGFEFKSCFGFGLMFSGSNRVWACTCLAIYHSNTHNDKAIKKYCSY